MSLGSHGSRARTPLAPANLTYMVDRRFSFSSIFMMSIRFLEIFPIPSVKSLSEVDLMSSSLAILIYWEISMGIDEDRH